MTSKNAAPLDGQATTGGDEARKNKKKILPSHHYRKWDDSECELLLALRAMGWTYRRIHDVAFHHRALAALQNKFSCLTNNNPWSKARFENMENLDDLEKWNISIEAWDKVSRLRGREGMDLSGFIRLQKAGQKKQQHDEDHEHDNSVLLTIQAASICEGETSGDSGRGQGREIPESPEMNQFAPRPASPVKNSSSSSDAARKQDKN